MSWLIHRHLLAPIIGLQRGTQAVAAGNLELRLGVGGNDEIAALSRDFDTMTQSLRESFARIELSNRDLTASNKELEAFGYSVSHDLHAPLRSIDGFSLALLEDYSDKLDDAGRDALERIRAASQRMGGLIDDLLRLSRVTRAELDFTGVNLSAMANELAAGIDRDAGEHLVQWVVDPGLRVMADPALMRIAMQNLMQNAWKFTLGVARPEVRVGASLREGEKVYCVADNGVGFDMASADRLFRWRRKSTRSSYAEAVVRGDVRRLQMGPTCLGTYLPHSRRAARRAEGIGPAGRDGEFAQAE